MKDCLTRDSESFTEIESRCVECNRLILETIRKELLPYHRRRIRCCRCLSTHYGGNGTKHLPHHTNGPRVYAD